MLKNRILFVGVLGILVLGQSLDYYWLQKDENIKKQAQNSTKTVQTKENSLKNIKNKQKQVKNTQNEDKKWLRNINLAEKYQKYIYDECQKYNFDYDLALAVAKYESNYNIYAKNTNSDGSIDQGLFQLNSFYSKKVAQELKINNFNPYNPYHNIKVGIYILATHRDYWLGKGLSL
ncbi:MAG: lytic transglycosylase domain-containing protein, partial [bacterium]|nr:lytic transglycosylase domain-containing protein [bacterium]